MTTVQELKIQMMPTAIKFYNLKKEGQIAERKKIAEYKKKENLVDIQHAEVLKIPVKWPVAFVEKQYAKKYGSFEEREKKHNDNMANIDKQFETIKGNIAQYETKIKTIVTQLKKMQSDMLPFKKKISDLVGEAQMKVLFKAWNQEAKTKVGYKDPITRYGGRKRRRTRRKRRKSRRKRRKSRRKRRKSRRKRRR